MKRSVSAAVKRTNIVVREVLNNDNVSLVQRCAFCDARQNVPTYASIKMESACFIGYVIIFFAIVMVIIATSYAPLSFITVSIASTNTTSSVLV